MERGGLRTQTLIACTAVIAIAATGFMLLSHFAAADYTMRLSAIAKPLHKQIAQYEKTTYASLFDDPSAPDTQQQKETDAILRQSSSIMAGVALLDQTTSTLQPIPLASLNAEYQKAYLLQDKSRSTTKRITDAVTHYQELVGFLKQYSSVQSELRAQLTEFNAVNDFNLYIGQGGKFRADAASLRQSAQSLPQAPHGVSSLRATLVDSVTRTANEFDTLANALDIGSDVQIYTTAGRIETISRGLDTNDQARYARVLADSRTIRNVRGLGDTLDLLQ